RVHGVDADAASGHACDAIRGRESWPGEDANELALVELRLFLIDDAVTLRALENFRAIDSPTVVADLDHDGRSVARRAEHELTHPRFSSGRPHIRPLDAVIDGVSKQVHDRIAKLVEHRSIELDIVSLDDEVDLFPDALRGVSHDARKAVEHLRHGNHAA